MHPQSLKSKQLFLNIKLKDHSALILSLAISAMFRLFFWLVFAPFDLCLHFRLDVIRVKVMDKRIMSVGRERSFKSMVLLILQHCYLSVV